MSSEDRIFKASGKKALGTFLISVCFVALGAWLSTRQPTLGWVTAGFFALCGLASLLMMHPSSTYLRLTSQGLEMASPGRTTSLEWADVDGFLMTKMSHNKMIGIVYSSGYDKQRTARKVASAVAGIEGGIGDHYDASLEEICDTLNEWHLRFGRGAS